MPSDINPPLPPDSTRLYSAADRANESHEPSPYASRRVIPSGRVSPDGKRTWPQPSLTSKVVIFGGIGIAAAAATAGAVLGLRAIMDAVAGDDEEDDIPATRRDSGPRRERRPRPSSYGPRPASALGFADARGGREGRYEHSRREDRPHREATHRRPPAAHNAGVAETVGSVARSVRDVLGAVTVAIEGFRAVSSQAGEIVADFNRAADQVRTIMEPSARPRPRKQPQETGADPRDGAPVASDPRSHRL